MGKKLKVAVLGATGAVGQRFVQLLQDHPWFEVAEVVGSDRSAGQKYGEVTRWILDGMPPEAVASLQVKPLNASLDSALVFSALPTEPALERERTLAAAGHVVCTNASAHRMDPDVPLLLPEVNAAHVELVDVQRKRNGWTSGALVANSNCTTMPVVMTIKPLLHFGVRAVHMISQQAISGAGHPGVPSMDITDNVIPYVSGDEGKMETEPRKMLGTFTGDDIQPFEARLAATCTRVPVIDGHLVHLSVDLEERPSLEAIRRAWEAFRGPAPVPSLPTAPTQPLVYLEAEDRPQPRRDRMTGRGMTTVIGRLRPCPILGYRFVALSHNTIRGAAGGSILNAELLVRTGKIKDYTLPVV